MCSATIAPAPSATADCRVRWTRVARNLSNGDSRWSSCVEVCVVTCIVGSPIRGRVRRRRCVGAAAPPAGGGVLSGPGAGPGAWGPWGGAGGGGAGAGGGGGGSLRGRCRRRGLGGLRSCRCRLVLEVGEP